MDPRAFTHAAGAGAQLAAACTRLLKLTNRLLEQLSRAKVRPGHFRVRENAPAGHLCRVREAQTATVAVQVTQIDQPAAPQPMATFARESAGLNIFADAKIPLQATCTHAPGADRNRARSGLLKLSNPLPRRQGLVSRAKLARPGLFRGRENFPAGLLIPRAPGVDRNRLHQVATGRPDPYWDHP